MTGHVFVAAGTINGLSCDDVIVSTDVRGAAGVKPTFWSVLGWKSERDRAAAAQETSTVRGQRWWLMREGSAAEHRPSSWLLDVGARHGDGLEWLCKGLRDVLGEAARRGVTDVPAGRPRRIAFPVLGVGGGGFNHQRGAVIRALLDEAKRAARELGVDVVIVASSRADYSALQSQRRQDSERLDPLDIEAKRLGDLARNGQLAIFMGAGTGLAAGLPTWSGLLERLAERLRVPGGAAGLSRLNALDAAELGFRSSWRFW